MHLMLCRTSRPSKYLCTASPRLNRYRGTNYNSIKHLEKPTAEHPSAGCRGWHCLAGSSCLGSRDSTVLQPLGENPHAPTIPTRLQRAAQGTRFWSLCCSWRWSLSWPTAWFKPWLPPGKYIRICLRHEIWIKGYMDVAEERLELPCCYRTTHMCI